MKQHYSLILLLLLASCSSEPQTEVDEIYAFMDGCFISEKQAAEDSNYYNVTLRLAHIWEGREGKWVYAEYGLTGSPETPYSQRIYQLIQTENNPVEMKSFDLGERQGYIGMWSTPEAFEALSFEDLVPRQGCSVYFEKKNDLYLGASKGQDCNPGLGNAEYWTHQFSVSEDRIINWARGFDANDSLIWGPANGGYVLLEIE